VGYIEVSVLILGNFNFYFTTF